VIGRPLDKVQPWRHEQLIRDLALGEKSTAELASDYGVLEQSISVYKLRHKSEVAEAVAGMVDSLGHLWATKMENRLSVLMQRVEEIEEQLELLRDHARRETELIRSVDPSASEVPVNDRAYQSWVKEQRAPLHEIADQCGGLPARVAKIEVTQNPITNYEVLAMDADGNLHAVRE